MASELRQSTLADWWPIALAVAAGAASVLVIAQLDRGLELFGPVVVMMAGIYLMAYALGHRPWSAWLALAGFSAVLPALLALDDQDLLPVDPGVAMSVLVVLVWLRAVVRYRFRDGGTLSLQTAGMVAFGAVTLVCVVMAPRWAALLAGAGFTAHAAWDFYHHQVNKVVHRSYAKFCFVIDVVTGPALVVAGLAQG